VKNVALSMTCATVIFLQGCVSLAYGTFSAAGKSDVVIDRPSVHASGSVGGTVLALPEFNLEVDPHNERVWINIVGVILPVIPLPVPEYLSNDSLSYSDFSKTPVFLVSLLLDPGSGGFSLDPREIKLQVVGADGVKSIGFFGPQPDDARFVFAYENAQKRVKYVGAPQPQNARCFVAFESSDLQKTRGEQESAMQTSPTTSNDRHWYRPYELNAWIAQHKMIQPVPITGRTCFMLIYDMPPPSPNEAFVLTISGLKKGAQPYPLQPIRFERHSGWGFNLVSPE
jgi:hypothetical protein